MVLFTVDAKSAAVRLDGTAGFELAADETPLNADSSWVVSSHHTDAGDELVVRDARTGDVRQELQTSQRIVGSAIVDGYFYWNQDSRKSAQDEIVTDGGVWRLLLPDGKAESIYPPDADAPADATLNRGRLAVSPSGATVGATLCQSGSCTAQVIDAGSGTLIGTVAGLVGLVTDEVVIVLPDQGTLSGYQFDGKLLWEIKSDLIYQLYLIRDGTALLTAYEGGAYPDYRYQVVEVDALTGATTEKYGRGADDQPWFLVADLSTDEFAVLVGDVGVSEAIRAGLRHVALLDLDSDISTPAIYPNVLPTAAP